MPPTPAAPPRSQRAADARARRRPRLLRSCLPPPSRRPLPRPRRDDGASSPSFARSPRSRRRPSGTTSTSRRSSSSPALVYDADEKIELYAKAADLYVNKFANQAEAVKAYEAILAIDPNHAAGDRLPARRCTRSAATGRSSSGCSAARPSDSTRARARGEVPRRSRSSRPSGSRSPRSASSSGRRCSRTTIRTSKRSARSRGLYERNKEFEKLATVLEKQAELTYEPPAKIRDPLQARHDLRRSTEQRRRRRRGVARAPHARPERPQGARGAQEEVPRARTVGRPRGLLRREREVGRVHPRPRAAGGEGDRARGEDLSPLQDRAALGGQEAEARSRRQGLREGARARAEQSARGRGAHPDLHAGGQREGARERDRGQALARGGSARPSSRSFARSRPSTRGASAIRRRRSSVTSRRSRSRPATSRRARTQSARRRSRASGSA